MNSILRWGFALALAPLAACNSNPGMPLASTVPTPQTLPSISAQDQQFLQQAAVSDMFEMQSSELALQRSRNPRTTSFAQRMIDDHSKSSQQLAELARANGVVLPTGLGPEQQRAMTAIQNTSRIFDSEYFRQQSLAHQNAVTVYQTEISSGYNNDIKAFAQQTLPTLQDHLQLANAGRQMPMGRVPARRPLS